MTDITTRDRQIPRFPTRLMVLACVAFTLLVILVGIWFFKSESLQARVEHLTIQVRGATREYRLVVPFSLQGKRDQPMVIALHGALDTTDEMAEYTQLDSLAGREGFLLVYLQGRLLNWPPSIPDENPDVAVPDLEFFDAICDYFIDTYQIDANRVYLTGVSQGGGMCNLVVALRSERIAAAVCNCGWMPKPLDVNVLKTVNKCPILFIAGSQDKQVPFEVVLAASRCFEKEGHPVDFMKHPGGHGWNHELGVNETLWKFLKDKRRETRQIARVPE